MLNKPNIGIVGYGVVGRATAEALEQTLSAKIQYLDLEYANTTYRRMCKECEYIFICVPTPTSSLGTCKTSMVEDVLKRLQKRSFKGIVVIKSTVPPPTTKMLRERFKMRINFNPEFLSEDTAFEDALRPEVNVIGGEEADVINEELYKNDPLAVITDSSTAEMIKYFFNSLFLLKVVYANQMFDIGDKLGVNFDTVLKAARKHKWVGDMHFKVFDKGFRGAAGKCLPKDAKVMGFSSPLLKEAVRLNEEYLKLSNRKPSYEIES